MDARATGSIAAWFDERIPGDWFQAVEVLADGDEILVTGTITEPTYDDGEDHARGSLRSRAIEEFRERTRRERMDLASQAESLFNRKVSWAVRCGEDFRPFTGLAVPVMTRLRLRERSLLDTLVQAGVARSRSHAVGWCLRLVAQRQEEWLSELRDAFEQVRQVREKGPDLA